MNHEPYDPSPCHFKNKLTSFLPPKVCIIFKSQRVFTIKDLHTNTSLDESRGMPVAMERLNIINEMECRMACSSSKVQHIMKFSLQDLQSEMYICG